MPMLTHLLTKMQVGYDANNFVGGDHSRHAEKYVRKCRLDWPEGATSRESIKAVQKLPRLQVCFWSIVCT